VNACGSFDGRSHCSHQPGVRQHDKARDLFPTPAVK
jgi:hypothetical protein